MGNDVCIGAPRPPTHDSTQTPPITDTELKLKPRKFISKGVKRKGMPNDKAMSLKVVISEPDVGLGDISG